MNRSINSYRQCLCKHKLSTSSQAQSRRSPWVDPPGKPCMRSPSCTPTAAAALLTDTASCPASTSGDASAARASGHALLSDPASQNCCQSLQRRHNLWRTGACSRHTPCPVGKPGMVTLSYTQRTTCFPSAHLASSHPPDNSVKEHPLAQQVVQGMLPAPTLVSAIYTRRKSRHACTQGEA